MMEFLLFATLLLPTFSVAVPVQYDEMRPGETLGENLSSGRNSFAFPGNPGHDDRPMFDGQRWLQGLKPFQKRSPEADPGGEGGLTLSITANMDALRTKLMRELMRRQMADMISGSDNRLRQVG